MKRKLIALIMLVVLCNTAKAQDVENELNPVYYGVTSLAIAPDARAGAIGDVGVATDPDVSSQYWNPAKYPFCISRAGVSLNYTPWLRQIVSDIDLANITGYYRIGEWDAISASLRYFSLGEVFYSSTGFDNLNVDNYSESIRPYEMSFDVAYSRMLSETFSLGVGLRWIYSDLRYDYFSEGSKPASAFAADIAMYYNNYIMLGNRECQLGLGLTATNIGSKISFYGDEESQFIPANLRLGASLMIPFDEYNRFTIAADANKLLVPTVPTQQQYIDDRLGGNADLYHEGEYQQYVREEYSDMSSIKGIFTSFSDAPGGFKEELEEVQWSVGAEYVYHDQFSLRAGYHHESESKGNRKYFTVGGGFRMNVFSLDVGYVISTAQSNPLDQTLRFTLAFDMDGLKDLFK